MENKNILITGGCGFIGYNIAEYLYNSIKCSITVIDKQIIKEHTLPGITYIEGCITDSALFSNIKDNFDIVFHEAAITDTTVDDNKLMSEINTQSIYNILSTIKNNGRLVYASSAATYGHTNPPNIVGKNEYPANIYGESKLNLDKLLFNEYTNDKNIKIIALRYFNVYGPHEDYKGRMASMIIQLAKHMNNGKNPKIFKYGEQCRDFIYVKDVVQANIKAALSDKSGIYNVGTGKSRSFNDILLILKNLMNTDMETIYIDNPYTFYQDNTKADITTTCKDLNYDPLYSLEQGVSDYYQYLQNNWTKGNIE